MRSMAAADNGGDLLGNKELPVLHRPPPSSGYTWFQSSLILFISLGLVTFIAWCAMDNRSYYRRWREERYRKRIRRRYGIPDSDNDVFNVAYANAKRKEEQALGLKRAQPALSSPAAEPGLSSTGLRLRGEVNSRIPNRITVPADSTVQLNRLNHLRNDRAPHSPLKTRSAFPRLRSQANDIEDNPIQPTSRSSPEQKMSDGDYKRSRVDSEDEGAELMNLDEDVLGAQSQPRSKRGAKRQAGTDEEVTPDAGRKKSGKRARRISRRTQDLLLDLEEQENGDKLMELDDAFSRGKKRDRAEAGSTFGGDDDSPTVRGGKTRRKRRSTANAEAATEAEHRGTKRVHEIESTLDSDEDDRVSRAKLIRKRGKNAQVDADSSTDMSFDAPAIVIEPSCAGHKIGDEWVVNGQLFKVGRDGKRLRQVLVKKRRSRYSMPTDSQHPDTQAQMVVLMETWLNDEQFQAAEERGDVFSTKKPDEEAEVETPIKPGKTLLWTSTKNNIAPKTAFKDSLIANVIPSNPFDRPSYSSYGRRVSTGHDAFKQGTQSPVLTPSKSYSKWEKQDLEAEAMAKLRKKLEDQKKAALAESKKKVTFELPIPVPAPAMTSSVTAPAGLGSSPSDATSQAKDVVAKPANVSVLGDPTKSSQSITSSSTSQSHPAPSSTHNFFTPAVNQQASARTDSAPSKPPVPLFSAPPPAKDKEVQSTASVPSFSFSGAPAATATEPSKATFSFAQPSSKTTPSVASSNAVTFGEKKAESAPIAPTSSMANIFAPKPAVPLPSTAVATPTFSIKGAAQSDETRGLSSNQANQPPSSSSSSAAGLFNFGSNSTPATTTSGSGFSFNNASKTQIPPAAPAKAALTTQAPSPSNSPQFSFGFSKPESSAVPTPPTSATAKSDPPTFAFGVTSAPGTTSTAPASSPPNNGFPSSAFVNSTSTSSAAPKQSAFPSSTTAPTSASSPALTSSASSGPKFSFNMSAANNNSAAASNSSMPKFPSAQSSVFGNANTKSADVPKPLFGYAANNSSQSTTPSGTSGAADKTDKPFSFGSSSTPSVFGSAPASNLFGAKQSGSTTPFTFGAPASGASTPNNVFGNSTQTNIFGSSSSGSVFGNSQQKSS